MKRLRPRSPDWALQALVPSDASPPALPVFPSGLIDWMASALLLGKLPLGHLVPRAELMPPSSLRTFQLEPRWMLNLLAGVLSVGRTLSSDNAQDATDFAPLVSQAAIAAGLASPDGSRTLFSGQPISGFVLRSEVIKGWPKLEARGYPTPDASGPPLPCARWSVLADGSMIALFVGTMASFEVREPGEGLHFGLEQSGPAGQKLLRFVAGPGGTPPGQSLGPSSRTPIVPRGQDVMRVAQTAAQLEQALVAKSANLGPDGKPRAFTSAEFALQLLEGADSVPFTMTAPLPPTASPVAFSTTTNKALS